ncbi:hypothetical protein FQN54_003054 [Arachnomyces sp. PD_36]|nr:hypothetical protein FQN54_003054 [Arachnomyces sp. PD_36]
MASENTDPAPLGGPLTFNFSGKTAPNRFLKAAMTERLSTWDPVDLPRRGIPTKELINAYRRWGEGVPGVNVTGNMMITYEHLEHAGNAIIPPDAPFSGERFHAFKELATEAKRYGSLIVGQVSHPGRQVSSDLVQDTISASDVRLQFKGKKGATMFAKPHPASKAEIDDIVERFAHAAEFLYKAGFDGIQLHGAHGYLLAQFLSQTTNLRTDEYGGPLSNRARLILEIATRIRARVPASTGFMLAIKLNSVEFQRGGITPEECRDLCAMLQNQAQFDFVELSGGTYQTNAFKRHNKDPQSSTAKREAFFLSFAEIIAPTLSTTRVYLTGGFRSVAGMRHAFDNTSIDGIGVGRPLCQEPLLLRLILSGQVTAAKATPLDDAEFVIATVAAGTQIRQLGFDQQPLDLSEKGDLEVLQNDSAGWFARMKADKEKRMVGFVDVVSKKAVPYSPKMGVPELRVRGRL